VSGNTELVGQLRVLKIPVPKHALNREMAAIWYTKTTILTADHVIPGVYKEPPYGFNSLFDEGGCKLIGLYIHVTKPE
jgi:hypothetical protein